MTRVHILSGTIVSTVLLPWIPIASGLPELRPEWLIMLAGLTLLPVLKRTIQSPVTAWAVFVFFSYILSSLYGNLALGLSLDLSDITEFLKPILYVLLFILIASGKYSLDEVSLIIRVAIISLSVASLITVIQYFAPDLIRPLLLLYRADPDELDSYRGFRAWGTMTNPNVMGFVGALAFGLCLFTLRHRLFPLLLGSIFVGISFVAVFSTGSRTGMVCLAAVLFAYFVLEMKKNIKSLLMFGVAIVIVIWGFNQYLLESEFVALTVLRIMSLGAIDQDVGGWVARVEASRSVLENIYSSPILGHGPAKGQFMWLANIDNEYILILFRFGLVGLIATLGFVWALATRPKTAYNLRSPLQQSMRNLSLTLLGAAALFAYTAGTYGTFQIMFMLIILWCVPACMANHRHHTIIHDQL